MLALTLIAAALLPLSVLAAPQLSGVTGVPASSGIIITLTDPVTASVSTDAPTTTLTVLSSTPLDTTTVSTTTLPPSAPTDNGACTQLGRSCSNDDPAFTSVFNKQSCVAAIICAYEPVQYTVADFIKGWFAQRNGLKVPAPTVEQQPPFSINIFNQHSTDGGQTWSQQNFVDVYYGALSKINGPYPSSTDFAVAAWDQIAAWTGFCETRNVPYQNLADFFKYSSTVSGPATKC